MLEFNQSPLLRQYIDFNIQKRPQAKNSFEKDYFKLTNNSVFGITKKTFEKELKLRMRKKLMELTSKPTFVTSKIFNEKLVVVHKIKETLTLEQAVLRGYLYPRSQ